MKPSDRAMSILNWALKSQSEPVPSADEQQVLSEERMKDALVGKHSFTDDEREEMLRSPAARGKLRFLAEAHRAERLFRWRELSIQETLELQAAAGGPLDAVSVSNNDFTLTALPLDDQGRNWLLHLKIAHRVVTESKGGALIVRDEHGETWLSGSPDEDGEISSPWSLAGSPIERLASQRLIIEPT